MPSPSVERPVLLRVTCQDVPAGSIPPDTLLEVMRAVAALVRAQLRRGGVVSVATIGAGNPVLAIEWDGRAVVTARVTE